ncbi:MAG: hypothetical protein U0359_18290 [Byssovorax sp.]
MKRLFVFSIFAALLAAACSNQVGSGSAAATACSPAVPASCPSSAPSYQSDVAPLLETYCTSCHSAGGSEPSKLLDSYASAAKWSSDVESEIASCGMPPSGEAQPTDAEREVILTWIVCGANNN